MQIVGIVFCLLALGGALYTVLAGFAAQKLLAKPGRAPTDEAPGVSILKPLNGVTSGLGQALSSTFVETYAGPVQVVFGIQESADPATAVAEQILRQRPAADIAIVTDDRSHGANGKVSNLINMLPAARHDILVLADSDIEAPPNWLSAVVRELSSPGIGVVSCFYIGAGEGFWPELAAMGISYQFLPNALIGVATGLAHPCFGSTIALTRTILTEIGGFERFADCLADDYEIGRAVREKGYRLAYPSLVVKHLCGEQGLSELWRHELRWARTIRIIDAPGHWGSMMTHALPLGLIGAALLGFSPVSFVILAAVAACRLFLKYRIDHIAGTSAGPAWLLPVRDMLSFVVFLVSLFGSTIRWRGERFRIGKGGVIS